MLESARDAAKRVTELDCDAFMRDDDRPLAVAHLIQILGEAARRVSQECRASHPNIPWQQIVGMRHKIVHDYIHVDFVTVWETATSDLPPLIAELERIPGI